MASPIHSQCSPPRRNIHSPPTSASPSPTVRPLPHLGYSETLTEERQLQEKSVSQNFWPKINFYFLLKVEFQLKVALRLSPENKEGIASANSFISVDDRRKQVLLKDARSLSGNDHSNLPPKMFAFDHVFAEDAAQVVNRSHSHNSNWILLRWNYWTVFVQAEICASTLPEVLQSVINGNDGCVFGFGSAHLGKNLHNLFFSLKRRPGWDWERNWLAIK